MTKCEFCYLTYVAEEPEDRRYHAARHRRWEKAVATLGYHPQDYRDRERDKQEGHELAREGKTLPDQLAGANRVLRAWFDRSLSAAIDGGYWKRHPELEEYIAMIDVPHAFTPEVWAELRRLYGRRAGIIPSGRSYWEA